MRDTNVMMVFRTYSELLDLIKKVAPEVRIYVQSILPVTNYKENAWHAGGVCKNSTIRIFNEKLKELAREKGMEYIDLYSVYELNGSLNPAYTVDGIHIYGHYEPWASVLRKYIHQAAATRVFLVKRVIECDMVMYNSEKLGEEGSVAFQ